MKGQPCAFALVIAALVSTAASGGGLTNQNVQCVARQECLATADQHSIDAARKGQYTTASFGLLAEIGVDRPEDIPDPDIFDQWSQVWSAMTGEPYPNDSKVPYSRVSAKDVAALKTASAHPAIAEIVARAKHTRIVILDEDHLVPQDRAFGLQVARALRPLGYSVLAAEALTRDRDDAVSAVKMQQLAKDGYVRRASGYYLNDPVFADFLRQAMAIGYRLVSYESAGFTDEKTQEARSSRREQEQAENIVRRALTSASAKVLIYSGRHHAAKGPINDPNVSERLWMAERLKHLTGIDPLVIDQFELGEMPSDRPNVDLYSIASKKAKTRSMVLFSGTRPLVVGLLAGGVDLQVVHPRSSLSYGRPDWLRSLGRSPSDVPTSLLPTRGTRLVQAFLADEADDAIPIDQVLVTAGKLPPKLMLPKAQVRYAFQDYRQPILLQKGRLTARTSDRVSAQ